MNKKAAAMPALMFATAASLVLAACESSGNYRVGWVGDSPPPGGGTASSSGGDDGSSGGASSSGGAGSSSGGTGSSSSGGTASSSGGPGSQDLVGNLIVTAGNTVIGVAGKSDAVARDGVLPTAGVVTATVTGILTETGQTLVKLGEGTGGSGGGLILDGVGGKVGALVGIDLGKGTVIAAPEGSKSLIGLNVLAKSPTTGQLATVGALSGGKALAVDVNGATGGLLGGDKSLLGNVGKVVTGVTGGTTGGVAAGVAGGVTTGVLGGATGGVAGGVSGGVATPSPQPATTGIVGGAVKTVGGVTNGLLGGKKKP
jgi:hypothetical protein